LAPEVLVSSLTRSGPPAKGCRRWTANAEARCEPQADFQLHHVGIAVGSIDEATARFARRFGYVRISPIYEDPVQAAFVQFWQLPGATDYLEFVSPNGPDSHLHQAIKKRRHLNHICYIAPDLDDACRRLRAEGMFLVRPPVEAVAFRPRRIAWLLGEDGVPIELVDAGADPWARG
jgi:methylmalonyl-CoA/ethylmalonyl-CoA epimerase